MNWGAHTFQKTNNPHPELVGRQVGATKPAGWELNRGVGEGLDLVSKREAGGRHPRGSCHFLHAARCVRRASGTTVHNNPKRSKSRPSQRAQSSHKGTPQSARAGLRHWGDWRKGEATAEQHTAASSIKTTSKASCPAGPCAHKKSEDTVQDRRVSPLEPRRRVPES